MAVLVRKGVLSVDDGNEAAALAASLARSQGQAKAADMIEASVPSSKVVDPIELARARGDQIVQRGD